MTQRAQILILAPFLELAAAIRAVIREQFGGLEDNFLIVEANLSAAQKFVQREMPASIRVLVSRGGTSEMLKHMALPVIDIQTSGLDILRAIQRFDNTHKDNRIGVTGFSNIIYGCEEIEKFSLRRLMEIRLANEAEAHGKVMQAYQNGMGCLVGDAVSVEEMACITNCVEKIEPEVAKIHARIVPQPICPSSVKFHAGKSSTIAPKPPDNERATPKTRSKPIYFTAA